MATTLTKETSWTAATDYVDPLNTVVARLGTDVRSGLSSREARQRLQADGPNSFGKQKKISIAALLFSQFASSVVLLLVVAAVISAMLHEYLQTAGITVAIFINAAIGFLTEYQSRISLERLAALTEPTARVRRDGQEHSIQSTDLVRGDIVLLEPGDRIPADMRVVSDAAISVDESILTGESVSVSKTNQDTNNRFDSILFQATVVSSGRAKGVVIATGTRTRLGKLSITLAELDTATTPLERQLDKLGHKLTILTVVLCVLFAIVGMWQGLPVLVMIETSIALAVAAIPEGLPVVATLSLALGIKQMVKQKALVRRLPAVEALGCASVICTDKTGTLTQNKMLLTDLVVCFDHYRFAGAGYEPIGEVENVEHPELPPHRVLLQKLMMPAVLCNDARLENHGTGWHVHGDPTEGALLVAAAKVELDQQSFRETHPRVAELAFDLNRKRMSTINRMPDGSLNVYCKGAPQAVAPVCNRVLEGGKVVPAHGKHFDYIEQQNKELSEQGLRVLALAYKPIAGLPAKVDEMSLESDLIFVGLVAMYDPPKAEVYAALDECRKAGIHVIMLTGDQSRTAYAVGRRLGICRTEADLLSGEQVQLLSNEELTGRLKSTTVFARVTPELKLLLVSALQHNGDVVAMTGDGVNDAPALKQADIGVAMGKTGSDLARDASALVITDDNFATIVNAISEGRQIYNKIKCAIGYLLSASLASLAVTGAGVFLREGLLLSPLQLLWLNLIMHVFPAIGLVMQQNWDDLMTQPPRPREEHLVDGLSGRKILLRAFVVTIVTLAAAWIDRRFFGGAHTTSAALTAISSSLVLLSWTWLRSVRERISVDALRHYKPMLINTAICCCLIFGALYIPGLNAVLQTNALPAHELIIVLALSLLSYVAFVWKRNGTGGL